MGILYAPLAFYETATTAGRSLSLRERVIDRGNMRQPSYKFGINISRVRPTVVEIDPAIRFPTEEKTKVALWQRLTGWLAFV